MSWRDTAKAVRPEMILRRMLQCQTCQKSHEKCRCPMQERDGWWVQEGLVAWEIGREEHPGESLRVNWTNGMVRVEDGRNHAGVLTWAEALAVLREAAVKKAQHGRE